jgi:hypothetical protein
VTVAVRTLDAGAFEDLARLFEGHGNPAYRWCMLWWVPTSTYRATDAAGRRDLSSSG